MGAVETYRSGHNGADSKSVCRQLHVGSNPTVSANSNPTFVHRTDVGFLNHDLLKETPYELQ